MMMRFFDIVVAISGLVIFSPVLIPVMFLIWKQDGHTPFYVAPRVGKKERLFKMVKLRSMIINADKNGIDSTGANDNRITPVGQFVRKYKLDELTQLWNVLLGDMSLVGPRPNVQRETDLYTDVEKKLLDVRPGITDISSIVFSDEGDILKHSKDPDLEYNQLIRPWKSRLGLVYIENSSFTLNIKLIILTAFAVLSKERALRGIRRILETLEVDEQLIRTAKRTEPLKKYPPPGSDKIVERR